MNHYDGQIIPVGRLVESTDEAIDISIEALVGAIQDYHEQELDHISVMADFSREHDYFDDEEIVEINERHAYMSRHLNEKMAFLGWELAETVAYRAGRQNREALRALRAELAEPVARMQAERDERAAEIRRYYSDMLG